MYRSIVFFDLDGTLLQSDNSLTQDVVQAIQKLKMNNILPVIATGRSISESAEVLKQCQIDSIVAMNGSLVLSNHESVYSDTISNAVCKRLLIKAQKLNASLAFFSENLAWCINHSEVLASTFKKLDIPLPELVEDPFSKDNILSMVLCTKVWDEKIEMEFPELKFYRVSPTSLDIVSAGISKGTGVEKILKKFPNVKTYAFGDGTNDRSLFAMCDVGIAMGNAIPELMLEADYATTSNDEGGIIKGLNHYHLI